MNTQSSLPSLKAVGGLCLEVSLRTWCLTHFCINVLRCRTQDRFRSERNTKKWVRLPGLKRDLKTDHLRPPYLAARTLSLVEHTLSTFGGDPCPVRRRLVAVVMCYVRKKRSFFSRQRSQMTHHDRRHCSRVWYDKGKTCYVFCFVEWNLRKTRSFLRRQLSEMTHHYCLLYTSPSPRD